MTELEIKRLADPEDVAAVSELIEVATRADGHPPLGVQEQSTGLVAREPGHDRVVGYARLAAPTPTGSLWTVEYVVDPHHRSGDARIAVDLVAAARDLVQAGGGGRLQVWVREPGPHHGALAETLHLTQARELFELRRPLPLEPEILAAQPSIGLRTFTRGRDERAWLEVNNRAFDWHPEQGGWDLETLEARQAEPWFDPEGFLLHERDGRLAAFCWTKVHADHDPPLGEIYVIAVDPDFHGLGLGRALTVAGLDHLARRGLRMGMLYVDGENTAARTLYGTLGFTVDHVERAYVVDV